MSSQYFPFTLRLYDYALHCLGDRNFTGLDLFYNIKDCWKGRDTPNDFLFKPLERGLPMKIGEWCFELMLDVDGHGAWKTKPYFRELGTEDFLWFVEDVLGAVKLSDTLEDATLADAAERQLQRINDLYEENEDKYWLQVGGSGRRELIKKFKEFRLSADSSFARMKEQYAYEVADRILHDRQLCSFIAGTLLDIGFDGEGIDGLRRQWVARERWPTWVRSILYARDRGKCALCGVDIAQELREEAHIDHIFPISRGGCNDIVNLQLLCSTCNGAKLDRTADVRSSVPQYVRRKKKRTRS